MNVFLQWALRILIVVTVAAVALTAAALWWGSRDATIYASGFTDEAFERVEPGMELADVYSLLGSTPGSKERRFPGAVVLWRSSAPPRGQHLHRRGSLQRASLRLVQYTRKGAQGCWRWYGGCRAGDDG